MEFDNPKGIYQQIAEQVQDSIAIGEWPAGEKIPSLREFAVLVGVNPNTVARGYQTLLDEKIIENRRGIGYFVMQDAKEKIVKKMKKKFIEEEMPKLFCSMDKLGIRIEECIEYYKRHIDANTGGVK